jgi:poly-gamma-glutamate synthesis protein (capsule biosynthesis protein)
MKILIAGDFFISDNFKTAKFIEEKTLQLFHSADYRIINLESPMSDSNKQSKILKTGPHLKSLPQISIPVLEELKVNLVTLANNHILDYGEKALLETIENCKKNGINCVGAGVNNSDAQKSFIIKNDNYKIAIINIAENEWASATNSLAGANGMDIIDNVNQIVSAKKDADFVLVFIHGGHEYYHYPSPRMVKQYRFYAENGASAIIGHHPHCISGYEIYNNVPIFYSIGNFLFTMSSKYTSWYTGLILKLDISHNESSIKFEIYPVKQNDKTYLVELLEGIEKNTILEDIDEYNKVISNTILIEKQWTQFLNEKKKQYLRSFSLTEHVPNRYLRAILSKLNLDKVFLSKNNIKQILNQIQCEAHVDATKEILSQYLNKIK